MSNQNYTEMSLGKPQSKYRYERKYNMDVSEYDVLLFSLQKEGMKIHHPPRTINNLYFDTPDLDAYLENVEGLSERNKYRLRWYGERFQEFKPTFEVKMKRDTVNTKQSVKLNPMPFHNLEDVNAVCSSVMEGLSEANPLLYIEMQNKQPTLLNGYQRDYYISIDKVTRLTIDRNMYFYNCQNGQENSPFEQMVVEVKYPAENEPKINFDEFKLNIGKSSKYVSGLDYTKY